MDDDTHQRQHAIAAHRVGESDVPSDAQRLGRALKKIGRARDELDLGNTGDAKHELNESRDVIQELLVEWAEEATEGDEP